MPYVKEIARLDGVLSGIKEANHFDTSRILEEHHVEIGRLNEQHHVEIARLNDQQNTRNARSHKQMMQLMASKDSQITAIRGELDAMNKKVLDAIKIHSTEVKNLRAFHHRRMLRPTGNDSEKMIEGNRLSLGMTSIQILTNSTGSVGMTEVWKKVENSGDFEDGVQLPTVPDAALVQDKDLPKFPATLKVESKMYSPILKSLATTIDVPKSDNSQGARTWQTDRSNIYGYSGKKPDLLVTVDVATVDLSSIIAPWEVKVKRPTRKDFGQLYGYIHALVPKQRARRKFVGVLQSLAVCYVILLERDTSGNWTYKRSLPMTVQAVLSWFRFYVITGADFSPHFPKFSNDLGELKQRLGDPAFCAVGMFELPDIKQNSPFATGRWVNPNSNPANVDVEQRCVVVKRILPYVDEKNLERPVKDEIEILIRLEELKKMEPTAQGPKFLPDLLFYSMDLEEFGMLPVGTPLHPEQQRSDWPTILSNVLSALEWIHSHDIVHRDVRWSNVVHYVDHAVLVDFGEAVDVRPGIFGDPNSEGLDPADVRRMRRRQVYGGGLLCCPPRLLGLLHRRYTPLPADDLHALVLMANMLVWPKLWTRLNPRDVLDQESSLTKQLKQFWKAMELNRIWKPYVEAAVSGGYDTLQEMGWELCVFLGSGSIDPVDQTEDESLRGSEAEHQNFWGSIGGDDDESSEDEEEEEEESSSEGEE